MVLDVASPSRIVNIYGVDASAVGLKASPAMTQRSRHQMASFISDRRRRMQREETAEDFIVGQIDELQRVAEQGRNDILGQQFFDEVPRFYNFDVPGMRRVLYHPMVRVADLQMLILKEAGELALPKPRFFIGKRRQPRDKGREEAFQANWEHFNFQLEWLVGSTWAGIVGTTPMQVNFDPDADGGLTGVKLFARNPDTYYPDPGARNDDEREYYILEDWQTVEEIAAQHGTEAASLLTAEDAQGARIPRSAVDFPARGLTLPPGPMRGMGPLGHGAFATGSGRESRQGRIRKRTLVIKDSTRMPFTDHLGYAMASDYQIVAEPGTVPRFPSGRVIVEAQRRLLYDGPNPYSGMNVFRLVSLPPLFGYWAPPPIRYTQDLQILAEELFSQAFENAYRMNNVEKYIPAITGLTPADIDNLPGRVYFTDQAAGDKSVQVVTTPPFPEHFIKYPQFLLELQRYLWGMTASREGKAAAGNVGMGLFDAEVYQAQALTRLKSFFLADCMQRVARFVFRTMVDVMGERDFPVAMGGDLNTATWYPDAAGRAEDWQVVLDAASIRIDSATALRNLGLTLARLGQIDPETLLSWLDAPDRDEILQRLNRQQMIQMLMGGGPKKGKK